VGKRIRANVIRHYEYKTPGRFFTELLLIHKKGKGGAHRGAGELQQLNSDFRGTSQSTVTTKGIQKGTINLRENLRFGKEEGKRKSRPVDGNR